jgi:hypothetical protein
MALAKAGVVNAALPLGGYEYRGAKALRAFSSWRFLCVEFIGPLLF